MPGSPFSGRHKVNGEHEDGKYPAAASASIAARVATTL